MKTPVPVTISDLEATAQDAKDGIAEYRNVKVYWDDATKTFNYYWKHQPCIRSAAKAWMEVQK